MLILLTYLSNTTVTFANVFLACTFVACSNKLYCIVFSLICTENSAIKFNYIHTHMGVGHLSRPTEF